MSADHWAEWLRSRRHGGDPEALERMLAKLAPVREKVLDGAALAEGETLLDVGCGDGLIAFSALDRGARVVFSDVSQDLLDACRARAEELGLLDRCEFVRASADDLPLGDGSVDAVTTRSVLIYLEDKARAFAEFARVLRPGGRISLWEPINRFHLGCDTYPKDGVEELAAKVDAVFAGLDDALVDFDERDLVRLAEEAGFFPFELDYAAEVRPVEPQRWETFAGSSGNPLIPTFGEAVERALTPEEAERFVAHLRPLVEEGRGTWRMAHAHLRGVKA